MWHERQAALEGEVITAQGTPEIYGAVRAAAMGVRVSGITTAAEGVRKPASPQKRQFQLLKNQNHATYLTRREVPALRTEGVGRGWLAQHGHPRFVFVQSRY